LIQYAVDNRTRVATTLLLLLLLHAEAAGQFVEAHTWTIKSIKHCHDAIAQNTNE
jgi:hypothetical protein